MLVKMSRKDDKTITTFLEILRVTNNEFCANKIEGTSSLRFCRFQHPKVLKRKWWPGKVLLIKSLYQRKCVNNLIIEVLHEKLWQDENQMTVICESETASQFSGMGGIGKTLTAIWYANHYEHEYEHIIWIDCGEDSLLKSFKRLARDLKVEGRNEMEEKEDFAKECFYALRNFKCLIIFDNAESYKGKKGIKNILPRSQNHEKNLYCLITSRCRDWGVENVGYGKITDLQLDIFSGQESLEFFKENLSKDVHRTENEITKLCTMLDNLPLALQLALAALNSKKINLQKYIYETSVNDLENIVNVEFDDYEKTINKCIQVSFDLIATKENGQLALQIIKIFGYIRPEDVPVDFFKLAIDSDDLIINQTIKSLIKSSLISERKAPNDEKEIVPSLSIHRLLQQVIRLNCMEIQDNILRLIFSVDGFGDYKLLPFTKYASTELQEEFPRVKAELVDQERLQKLLKEKKWEEAEHLSEFIYKAVKTEVTLFNYSICLQLNGNLVQAQRILEQLSEKIEAGIEKHDYWVKIGILHLERAAQLTKELIKGHLLVVYWILDNMQKTKEILNDRKPLLAVKTTETLEIFLQIVSSFPIHANYKLHCDYHSIIHLQFDKPTKEIIFQRSISSNLQLPVNNLHELTLDYVTIRDEYGKKVDIFDFSKLLPPNLKRLKLGCYDNDSTKYSLSLGSEKLRSIEYLSLYNCLLTLKAGSRLTPKELTFSEMSFFDAENELSEVTVNNIVNIHKIKYLKIICQPTKQNVLIDVSDEPVLMQHLELINVTILNTKQSNWKVKKLVLGGIDVLEKTTMEIDDADLFSSLVDISCLPATLRILSLWYSKVESNGKVNLPNLKRLELNHMDSSCLSHFSSLKFTQIGFRQMREVDVDLLPASVTCVKINSFKKDFELGNRRIVGGKKQLSKLILKDLYVDEMQIVLQHLETEQLVICNYSDLPYYYESLESISKMKTIAIGRCIPLSEGSPLASSNKKEFFLFQNRTKKPINEEEFNNFLAF